MPSSTVSAVPTAPPKASAEEHVKAKVRAEKEKELHNYFLGEISKLQTPYQREAMEYVEQIKKGRKDVETERDSFNKFFQSWIDEQDRHLHELISVSKTQAETKSSRDKQERVSKMFSRVVISFMDKVHLKTRFFGSVVGDPAWLFIFCIQNLGCRWNQNLLKSSVDTAQVEIKTLKSSLDAFERSQPAELEKRVAEKDRELHGQFMVEINNLQARYQLMRLRNM
ncbi:hypothetical protein IFM89_031492 [Coptis chinensis]|uniref:Uncharacterized protein n=1 Tax=Coptis chinensis TaxID=261450 RepID=A0A835LPH0_9MAGN|nr:hypothetical protein IFM89_031492 [Coptis chinensis]